MSNFFKKPVIFTFVGLLIVILLFSVCFSATIIHDPPPIKSDWLQDAPEDCHPEPNINHLQYVVGYGSLIKHESKLKTAPRAGPSIPVLVKGFSREFNAQGPTIHSSTTYLGIIPQENSSFNGVVFQIQTSKASLTNKTLMQLELDNTFHRMDLREDYYCRKRVAPEEIIPLISNRTLLHEIIAQDKNYNQETVGINEEEAVDHNLPNNATGLDIWIYINRPEFSKAPNEEYPIVQSYVDIFIAGCLQVEENFHVANYTNDCIQSTKGWDSGKWVNDRIYPRRAFLYQPKAYQIDKALFRNVPKPYKNIVIEG